MFFSLNKERFFNVNIEEIQQNIKFAVASYIDAYGMEFVLDVIKSIKMEEGITASEALMKEYYLNVDNAGG